MKAGDIMTNTQVVANTFLYYAFQENIDISPMKLQKLMYFLFREYAKSSNKKLFSEPFEAWAYGPVLPSIYYEFQSYGKRKIDKFAKDAQGHVKILGLNNNDVLKRCFYTIWARYKFYSGPELSSITHKVGTAWYKAKENGNPMLSFEDILNDNEY